MVIFVNSIGKHQSQQNRLREKKNKSFVVGKPTHRITNKAQ